jgi:hypothetical protein
MIETSEEIMMMMSEEMMMMKTSEEMVDASFRVGSGSNC